MIPWKLVRQRSQLRTNIFVIRLGTEKTRRACCGLRDNGGGACDTGADTARPNARDIQRSAIGQEVRDVHDGAVA